MASQFDFRIEFDKTKNWLCFLTKNRKKDAEIFNSARNGKLFLLEIAVFIGGGISSLQFHIIHAYENTTEESWNSLMKDAAPTYRQVPKTTSCNNTYLL